jgi:hypothetical protein
MFDSYTRTAYICMHTEYFIYLGRWSNTTLVLGACWYFALLLCFIS